MFGKLRVTVEPVVVTFATLTALPSTKTVNADAAAVVAPIASLNVSTKDVPLLPRTAPAEDARTGG